MSDFNLVETTVAKIEPLDDAWFVKAKQRLDRLTKPLGSLGKLEDLAQRICVITQKEKPSLKQKIIFTLAADHGITAEGVSAYPSEVTVQMVLNFLRGGAGINVLARAVGARVIVVDIGVAKKLRAAGSDSPRTEFGAKAGHIRKAQCRQTEMAFFRDRKINLGTKNFAKEAAMSRAEAIRSVATGIQLIEEELKNGVDIVGTGEMGIGNTTPSSAITAVMTGMSVSQVTGQGTGIETGTLPHKVKVIEKALALHQPNPKEPLDVLSKVGGFEIGGLAGIILGAASHRIPVMLDGFISGAAALIANGFAPQSRSYMIAAHRSAEPGHDAILKFLGLSPLLDLKMRLGEGTGAALGMSLADAACKILNEMATFEEAQVSGKIEPAEIQK